MVYFKRSKFGNSSRGVSENSKKKNSEAQNPSSCRFRRVSSCRFGKNAYDRMGEKKKQKPTRQRPQGEPVGKRPKLEIP